MRDSLRKSLADSPAGEQELYPKGSTVVCNACSLPIAFLDRAIYVGDGAGRSASKMKPLDLPRLRELMSRTDIDAGLQMVLRAMTPEQQVAHVAKLHEFKAGDPMLCPCCTQCFVQVIAVEPHEVLDKAYTIEPLLVPPPGHKATRLSGRKLGYTKEWVH